MNMKKAFLFFFINALLLFPITVSHNTQYTNTAPKFMLHTLFAQEQSTEVRQYIRTWLSENKYASQKTIVAFVNDYIPTLNTTEDTYYVLINIINSYPTNKISAEIYILFAKIASLKFDFSTASLMYHTSYNMTKDYQYLVQAAIQEFQNGHIDTANEYITTAFENTLSPTTHITAIILKSELLLLTEQAFQVLKFLENEQYNIKLKHINAPFLYQVYRISLRSNHADAAEQIYTLLKKKFPDSIETQTIGNANIAPLPLPSLLFNPSFSRILFSDTNTSPNKKNSTPLFSDAPKVGYQVASYTTLSNAVESLDYFKKIWDSIQTTKGILRPILVKKTLNKKVYYQVMFPLNSSKQTRETQSLILQNKNIEGFMTFND